MWARYPHCGLASQPLAYAFALSASSVTCGPIGRLREALRLRGSSSRAHSSSELDTLATYARHTLVCRTQSPIVPSILGKCAEHSCIVC